MNLADIKESAWMAIDTVRTNKLRSSLTILGVSVGVITVMFMVDTPSFDTTTQQACTMPCCLEETRREAGCLPKNKRRSVWMKRCGARHTKAHTAFSSA